MRLWSIHPKHLDTKGLTAVWREGLLAQKVLRGLTKGYTKHPQLQRFREHPRPLVAISEYLLVVHTEATDRGYNFDITRIYFPPSDETLIESKKPALELIDVADGQLDYEWGHLKRKLSARSPDVAAAWKTTERPDLHPLFVLVEGEIADWERP